MDPQKAIRSALRIAKGDGGAVTTPDTQPNDLGLYSGAAAAARALPQAKGTPQQMLASLKGVKPDELKWSGAQQAFAGRPTVTKEELAQHFEQNLPKLTEKDPSGGAKFSRYSTTGSAPRNQKNYGTNYREKLLTLPPNPPPDQSYHIGLKNAEDAAHERAVEAARTHGFSSEPHISAVREYDLARQARAAAKTHGTDFQSSHWEDPNVVAHLRMSDWQREPPGPRLPPPPKPDTKAVISVRPDISADRKKEIPAWSTKTPGLVVHKAIDKNQKYNVTHTASGMIVKRDMPFHHAQDLAQRLGQLTDWTVPHEELTDKFKVGTPLRSRLTDEFNRDAPPGPKLIKSRAKPAEKNLLLDELQSDWGQKYRDTRPGTDQNGAPMKPRNDAPPEAPYVTGTEKWTDLGLKRALHEAAKGGYHRLLWTPGEKQAKRYPHLSTVADQVSYHPDSKKFIAQKNGRVVLEKSGIEPHKLPDYIGKDRAQTLLNMRKNNAGYHDMHVSEAEVGGEGMKGYYDNIVPKRLIALAKEHDPEARLEHFKDKKGSPIDGFPSLPITEKMRESILKRGFKAYARGGAVSRSEDPKIVKKAIMIARGMR